MCQIQIEKKENYILATLQGEVTLGCTAEVKEKLKVAYDYGKQFYKDLKFFCEMHEEADFKEELFKALIIVQQIGEVYSKAILDAQPEDLA